MSNANLSMGIEVIPPRCTDAAQVRKMPRRGHYELATEPPRPVRIAPTCSHISVDNRRRRRSGPGQVLAPDQGRKLRDQR